ncbi:MAG: gluconokinase [Gemmatimonadota bacterium]
MSDSTAPHTGRYVVMGVSGAGKSAVGEAFAQAVGLRFVEGDKFHPPENVARMASGIPLTDDDRRGWLAAIAQELREACDRGEGIVVTCSALKRRYRDVLRGGAPDVRFIYLAGSRTLLADRMSHRTGHFMPAALLDSQLETLEPPDADEGAWTINIDAPVDAIVARLVTLVVALAFTPPGT